MMMNDTAPGLAPEREPVDSSLMFGPRVLDDGTVLFRLWAPAAEAVTLRLDGDQTVPLQPKPEGWHECVTDKAGPGTRYSFVLPDGMAVPDPASRFQPDDIHGPSQVVDETSFTWTDTAWRGRPWAETVLYELHVGTFTPEGTFAAAIGKLDHLVSLGVTTIELMPLGDFPGGRNWGYDGVYLFAPDASYGTPDDLKRLVDAAHARGLSVLLDVIYNHFGPDGNYLSVYAPPFFTDRHKTPWGQAINYDGQHSAPVRAFVFQNVIHWLRDFHLDGLRLDAVHAIIDVSEKTLLVELAERVRALDLGRPIHLILENENNEAHHLGRMDGEPVAYTAQWNDDVHHVLHTAATGEGDSYYAEYLGETGKLGRALAEGFAFQGEVMEFRGERRGEPSGALPPTAFVAFTQNHDQIGNRAFGDRMAAGAAPEAVRAVMAVCLLLPQIPMLFMGEEWGSTRPFPFFCDFEGELAEAVRKGRREEFKRFAAFQSAAAREAIPDPQAEATFLSAKLDWDSLDTPAGRAALERTTRLLAARRAHVIPIIPQLTRGGAFRQVGPLAVTAEWTGEDGTVLRLDANLKAEPQPGFEPAGTSFWQEGEADGPVLGPWSVRWAVQLP